MSPPPFHLSNEPSELSLRLRIRSLNDYCASKEMSPKNRAHRSRVIRQQTELFARQSAPNAGENRK
jgi:hypothetical protein